MIAYTPYAHLMHALSAGGAGLIRRQRLISEGEGFRDLESISRQKRQWKTVEDSRRQQNRLVGEDIRIHQHAEERLEDSGRQWKTEKAINRQRDMKTVEDSRLYQQAEEQVEDSGTQWKTSGLGDGKIYQPT